MHLALANNFCYCKISSQIYVQDSVIFVKGYEFMCTVKHNSKYPI